MATVITKYAVMVAMNGPMQVALNARIGAKRLAKRGASLRKQGKSL